ncbi:MAG: hypothetical protein RRC34_05960 [Lentisphaeria bacterium]|nr:hypothetical protein [Lentisphaeria bacterium]
MLLTTPEDVREFCGALAGSPFIAVDTEFQWDRTYFAGLSLVQLASPDRAAMIDCVAVDDLSPLRPILHDPDCLKIFHSASQDLAILARVLGAQVVNVYDTQIADAMLGGPHQMSYAKLVGAYLDIEVDKSSQNTDWLKRPLSEKQLVYAQADVTHLAEIYPMQRRRLADAGRLDWALEDSHWLETHPPMEATDPDTAYQEIKGWGRLDKRQLGNLMALARWREIYGRENDLRPRWLLADRLLLDFAQRGRFSSKALAKEQPWIARRADKLKGLVNEVLERAAETPLEAIPDRRRGSRPTPLEKELTALADHIISERAKELGIEKMILASRADFTSLVHGLVQRGDIPADTRLVTGWRKTIIGDTLAAAILSRRAER